MCGYMVELPEGVTACECPACGSMTTFPKCGSEHTEQLHARAEHFRQRNEFDKALDTYEAIVRETPDDAEAYWGMVLSRFGIEYVEDPISHERVPTCHRVQYESILSDSDYKSALEYADASQQAVYEVEAKRIAEIQKGILSISAQEKPFDIFICYKETTEGGSRTKDSAIAQDIYYQLVNAGYKVFFSRITLEDKLGQQYEPYIFAALNSAKVMLVVGSKKEYFNAVWVKNEWSRFLALMKKDRSRLLIPCYREMDAYDLPDELSMLQSQDMTKIGFMQDLLRGIKKVFGANKSSGSTSAPAQGDSSVAPLMKRIQIFLETGDYAQAIKYCDKVLDKEPENAEVYLLQFLAENRLKSEEEIYLIQEDLEYLYLDCPTFKQLMKFADAPLKARIQAQIKKQKDEIKKQKAETLYQILLTRESRAIDHLSPKEQITTLQSYAEEFAPLSGYKDSDERKRQYEQQAEKIRQQQYDAYNQAVEHCVSLTKRSTTPEEWKAEAERFKALSDVVPEAAEMAKQCEENIIVSQYNKAMEFKKAEKYSEAIRLFKNIKGYGDSEKQLAQCEHELEKNASTGCLILLVLLLFCVGVVIAGYFIYKQHKMNRIKSEAEMAYQQGQWWTMEDLGKKLGKLSSEEGQAVLARAQELHKKELMDAAELAYKQGNWQEMESLGKRLGEFSSEEEGDVIIARSRELYKNKLKEAAEIAFQQGNSERMESLGKELVKLSPKEGQEVISQSQELHKKKLKEACEAADQRGDWLFLEKLGWELCKLSSKEGEAVIARSQELHIKQLKDAAERAYQQGDLQKMVSLGKKLGELSSNEGRTVILRSKELYRVLCEKNPYLVIDLQAWKIRFSLEGPDLANDACRTTELWLRRITPGTFMMGSPEGEVGKVAGSETQHKVKLTQLYHIGIFECTQKQWVLVMGTNPSQFKGDNRRPVECVSYNMLRGPDKGAKWPDGSEVDTGSFFGQLQAKTGLAFDLPTEAQWEYACRAGTTTALNSGKNLTVKGGLCQNLNVVAWYMWNSKNTTNNVGQKQPNAWGLYDMHGNVGEWCLDWFRDFTAAFAVDPQGPSKNAPQFLDGNFRVVHGGNWDVSINQCRSASRTFYVQTHTSPTIGFRICCGPPYFIE